jgi:hypothetical protein
MFNETFRSQTPSNYICKSAIFNTVDLCGVTACRAFGTNTEAQHALLIVRVDVKNGDNIFFGNVGVHLRVKDNTASHL